MLVMEILDQCGRGEVMWWWWGVGGGGGSSTEVQQVVKLLRVFMFSTN